MRSPLFEKLKGTNPLDAQVIGKNLFCKEPSNIDVFNEYFTFCLEIAAYPIELDVRVMFANEAELALNVFSEKAEIDDNVFSLIQEKRSHLASILKSLNNEIQQEQAEIQKEEEKELEEHNRKILSQLAKKKDKLYKIKTQSDFDNILSEISTLENRLTKEAFNDIQTAQYESLTKDFSVLVSQVMADISHKADVEYNKKAADSFLKAYRLFKGDKEKKYKESDSHLYELVSKYLFNYDARRLFNETLIYYNHVYSYIFNSLDDDGKFNLTRYSFDTPKAN